MADGDDATTLEGRDPADATTLEGRGGSDATSLEGRAGQDSTTLEGASTSGSGFVRRNLPPPLAADYEVIRALSHSGAQADVYLARDKRDDSEVAIKLYRNLEVAMSAAEESLVAGCEPAHVVPTTFDQWGDEKWEIQEYMVRGTLVDLPKALGHNPTAEELHEVARELIEAVDHIHSRDLAHRDIKPSNILIRTVLPLDLVLADFGLSRTLAAGSQLGSMSRTERYAAPEVLEGVQTLDSDWWSLGITLAEVALGRHPFARNDGRDITDAQVMAFLIHNEVDVTNIRDDRLRLLVSGLLTKERSQRWGSTETAAWLRGESPTVHTPAPRTSVSARDWRFAGFLGQVYTSSESLGRALAENWPDALRYIQNDATKLRNALAKTALADEVENVFTRRRQNLIQPEGQLFELISLLAPSAEPTFRQRPLSPAGLSSMASAAIHGGADAAEWIHGLRTQGILQLTHNFENYPQFAVIDEKLSRWWSSLESARAEAVSLQRQYQSANHRYLNSDNGSRTVTDLGVVQDAAQPILEGTLLACALGDQQIQHTHNAVPAITSQHASWISSIAQRVPAKTPDPGLDMEVSVLASAALADKKIVDDGRRRAAADARNNLAKQGLWPKLWFAVPYLIVVGFGFILAVSDDPATTLDTFTPLLKSIGIGTILAFVACYLSDRYIGRAVTWVLAIAVSLGFTAGWSAVAGGGTAFAAPIIGATIGYVAAAALTRFVPALSDSATVQHVAPSQLNRPTAVVSAIAAILGIPLAMTQMVMSMTFTSGFKVSSWVTDMTMEAWPWLATVLRWFGGLNNVAPEAGAMWAIPCMIALTVKTLWNGTDRTSSRKLSRADVAIVWIAALGLIIAILAQWTIAVLVSGLLAMIVAALALGLWIGSLFI
ncbi:protein kinase domain-containing protein [Gordonia sp. 852002-51296_SCH5728562-b]|uniref:protein kinase domain-containing protein n=1 Tax=Gordonia sp. 852002-51296_SCH5728562-b TaxID=1834101 RepID=UPI0007E9CE93|nr:protein kinase [Gordonia sp. 852002-51296_SCH5728562-b]OBA31128.1 hypothetical protein A5766_13880 [Gordonia sp. 852002-51296_SCH5728562-b]